MPNRRLTVSVPSPCHQNWQDMTPVHQGRFCQNCAKTVVDFTQMTDAEVVQWLIKEKDKSCGRFRSDQLNRPFAATPPVRQRISWRTLAAALTAWIGTNTLEAKALPASYPMEIIPAEALPLSYSYPKDTTRILKGRVIDAKEKLPIPGVTVHLKNTAVATPTDQDGYYTLQIPQEISLHDQVVIFSFIGFMPQEHKISGLTALPGGLVELTEDSRVLGETVLVGGYHTRWFTPRGLYYTARNFFGYTIPTLFR